MYSRTALIVENKTLVWFVFTQSLTDCSLGDERSKNTRNSIILHFCGGKEKFSAFFSSSRYQFPSGLFLAADAPNCIVYSFCLFYPRFYAPAAAATILHHCSISNFFTGLFLGSLGFKGGEKWNCKELKRDRERKAVWKKYDRQTCIQILGGQMGLQGQGWLPFLANSSDGCLHESRKTQIQALRFCFLF